MQSHEAKVYSKAKGKRDVGKPNNGVVAKTCKRTKACNAKYAPQSATQRKGANAKAQPTKTQKKTQKKRM